MRLQQVPTLALLLLQGYLCATGHPGDTVLSKPELSPARDHIVVNVGLSYTVSCR
ncbi:hypothetical protein FKM82_002612 [Ascaphus truei]